MCAGKRKSNSLFIASSCFVLQTSSQHPVKLPLFLSPQCLPPPLCLTFLAAASCMGAFPEQKQICLVRRHFLSLDPCLFFYHIWKLNREPIVRRRMFSLFCLCFVTLCFASQLLCIACSFLYFLAKSQYNCDKWHFQSCPVFKRLFGLFLRFILLH